MPTPNLHPIGLIRIFGLPFEWVHYVLGCLGCSGCWVYAFEFQILQESHQWLHYSTIGSQSDQSWGFRCRWSRSGWQIRQIQRKHFQRLDANYVERVFLTFALLGFDSDERPEYRAK